MKKNTNKGPSDRTRRGFTITEVTLVTAFVAMLLIAIATITTSISAIYQKGITLKAINSVGRNLITELTTSINSAPSIDSVSLCNTLLADDASRASCINEGAFKYIYQSLEDASNATQYAGIFCTGNYSYVWNTYYGRTSGNTVSIQYVGGTKNDFKLLRFPDKTYRACSTNVDSSYHATVTSTIDIRELANGNTFNLSPSDFQSNFLETSDDTSGANRNRSGLDLDLYELTIFPISQDSVTLRAFFSGTFILATERGNVSILRTGDYCNVSLTGDNSSNIFDLGSEFNYCGINRFNFAARTAGSGV